MPATRSPKVRAVLSASDRASPVIKRVQGNFSKLGKFLATRFVFTLTEVTQAARLLFEELDRGGRLQNQTEALRRNLAAQGIAFDDYIKKLKEVSNEQVATSALIADASQAILLGIPADKIAELLEVARASAVATGQSISNAFNDIVFGIGRASPRILDNLGIIVKLGPAYADFARELGKSAVELSAQERQQALLNEVLRVGEDRIRRLTSAQSEGSRATAQLAAKFQNFRDAVAKFAIDIVLMIDSIDDALLGLLRKGLSELTITVGTIAEQLAILPGFVGEAFADAGANLKEIGQAGSEAADDLLRAAEIAFKAGLAGRAAAAGFEEFAESLDNTVIIEAHAEAVAEMAKQYGIAHDLAELLINQQIRYENALENTNKLLVELGIRSIPQLEAALSENQVKQENLTAAMNLGIPTLAGYEKGMATLKNEAEAIQAVLDGTVASVSDYNVMVKQAEREQRAASVGADQMATSIERVGFEARVATEAIAQLAFTSAQFDGVARNNRQAAVDAAVAAGGRLILGGTRVEFAGGGSRLTSDPRTGQRPTSQRRP